jgi:hypothetical protein
MILWIAIQGEPISIIGIFDNEVDAINACHNDTCFIGPLELNKAYTGPNWDGAYYPHDTANSDRAHIYTS